MHRGGPLVAPRSAFVAVALVIAGNVMLASYAFVMASTDPGWWLAAVACFVGVHVVLRAVMDRDRPPAPRR